MRTNRRLLESASTELSIKGRSSAWAVWRHILLLFGFAFTFGIIYVIFAPTFVKSQELKRQIREKDSQISELERSLNTLADEAQSLTSNPEVVARHARDRLNLALSDEQIFRFEPYHTSPRSDETPR